MSVVEAGRTHISHSGAHRVGLIYDWAHLFCPLVLCAKAIIISTLTAGLLLHLNSFVSSIELDNYILLVDNYDKKTNPFCEKD